MSKLDDDAALQDHRFSCFCESDAVTAASTTIVEGCLFQFGGQRTF